MKQANIKFTYQDYLLLSDEKRYEILEGDLCMVPAPDVYHQRVSRRLEVALIEHVERHDLGEILDAPCDVVLSQENVVQPDILFISKDRLGIIGKTNIQGPPDLVIEIVSESTRSKDTDIKLKLYAKYGVREYWIVDPAAKTVEVLTWSETGYVSAGVYPQTATLSSPELPNLKLSLSRLF